MSVCIVLAAGASSRMGAWKLLLPWKGLTVIETVVAEARAACDRVIVVAGYRAEDLAALLAGSEGVTVAPHPGWRKGQFTSLQTGAALLGQEPFFVTLGDLPGVTAALFRRLEEFRAQAPREDAGSLRACRPGTADRPGHPVRFDAGAAALIAGMDPSRTMRDVFPGLEVAYLPGESPGAFTDLDVPEDYLPGSLDPARTRCPARLFVEAVEAARRLGACRGCRQGTRQPLG